MKMNEIRKVEMVAAYIRVSTQEQKLHGISLDAQRAKLTEYAKANGMKIVEWYTDEGVSGRKLIRNRPELQRMIQDAEKGNFTRIIFIKLDRFFRSVAEYHECMKRIAPVIWTTTEEDYDLSTANGRMLVNMKLTIAELEADQGGERIKIVNEYKASTGQPLTGKMPFGWMIGKDEATGRKNVVLDPDEAPILKEAIEHYLTHQSLRKTIIYIHAKHHIYLEYKSFSMLLKNPWIYGTYRDNPNYCEPCVDKETFDKIQKVICRTIKENRATNRTYLFSGLIKCPECGRSMAGGVVHQISKGKRYIYKRYRCPKVATSGTCSYRKSIKENTLERFMLRNIEKYLADKKIKSHEITEADSTKIPRYNIEEINAEIDRLNYSWQKGRIRSVEKYEEEHDALLDKLALAEAEKATSTPTDFSKLDAILHDGWEEIYKTLNEENKRAFWRSFIVSMTPDWDGEEKSMKDIIFF
jgi:DNA invertase Pin-like site-specific DNA recombinase